MPRHRSPIVPSPGCETLQSDSVSPAHAKGSEIPLHANVGATVVGV